MRLKNKVAIVTGGSRDIGREPFPANWQHKVQRWWSTTTEIYKMQKKHFS
ncbi:hypothetical protein QF042_004855 [Pedobacter sp. W3I1]|nr:hypothetical protein [Pedobacter sp. W3I1]